MDKFGWLLFGVILVYCAVAYFIFLPIMIPIGTEYGLFSENTIWGRLSILILLLGIFYAITHSSCDFDPEKRGYW